MSNTVSNIISDEQLNRIIQIESAGNPSAKAGTSSAAGLGQFITATWLDTARKHRPAAKLTAEMRVGPATAALQLELLARFTEDNARALGAGFTDGDLYLAHFLGLGDARNLFRAAPGDLAASHVTAGAVAANKSILSGKTCAQVRAWAQASMVNRWDKAGRTDWVKKYAGAQPAVPPPPDIPKPASAPSKPPLPKEAAKKTGLGAAIFAALAAAAAFVGEHPFIVVGGIVAIVGGVIAWRVLRKEK